jgi:hypothetical protein
MSAISEVNSEADRPLSAQRRDTVPPWDLVLNSSFRRPLIFPQLCLARFVNQLECHQAKISAYAQGPTPECPRKELTPTLLQCPWNCATNCEWDALSNDMRQRVAAGCTLELLIL